MALVFFFITLFMIAVVVYIVVVRRKERTKETNASFVASDTSWLNALIDKIDNIDPQ